MATERTTRNGRARLRAVVAAWLALGWLAFAPPPAGAATASESRMASEIVAQINNERAARGLSRLSVNTTLASQSQQVAEDNRNRGCHSCHSGLRGAGEVVQWSGGAGASGRSTVAWMNSTTHRDILMSPGLTAIGVGVACYPDGGQEAVGRVLGNTTTGSPPTPVVTARSDGSRCGSPAPTSTTRATTTTTAASAAAAGGSNQGNDSQSRADGPPAPAPVAASAAPPPSPAGGGSSTPSASGTPSSPAARSARPPGLAGRPPGPGAAGADAGAQAGAAEVAATADSGGECSRRPSRFQPFGRRCVTGDGSEAAFAFPPGATTTTPTTGPRNVQAARSPLEDETTGLSGLDSPRIQGLVIAVGAVAALGLVSLWRFRAGRW